MVMYNKYDRSYSHDSLLCCFLLFMGNMHHSRADRLTTVCKYTLMSDIGCNIYKEIFKANISSMEKNRKNPNNKTLNRYVL